MVNREDLAFQAGWRAGFGAAKRPRSWTLSQQDERLTADWHAYKRETAEPMRCVDCQTMIIQGPRCELCRRSNDYRGIE